MIWKRWIFAKVRNVNKFTLILTAASICVIQVYWNHLAQYHPNRDYGIDSIDFKFHQKNGYDYGNIWDYDEIIY